LLVAFILADGNKMECWQLGAVLNLPDGCQKNTLEAKISRLRKKLEMIQTSPKPIQALRGEGYQLVMKVMLR